MPFERNEAKIRIVTRRADRAVFVSTAIFVCRPQGKGAALSIDVDDTVRAAPPRPQRVANELLVEREPTPIPAVRVIPKSGHVIFRARANSTAAGKAAR